jgi:hypothetical protein
VTASNSLHFTAHSPSKMGLAEGVGIAEEDVISGDSGNGDSPEVPAAFDRQPNLCQESFFVRRPSPHRSKNNPLRSLHLCRECKQPYTLINEWRENSVLTTSGGPDI